MPPELTIELFEEEEQPENIKNQNKQNCLDENNNKEGIPEVAQIHETINESVDHTNNEMLEKRIDYL